MLSMDLAKSLSSRGGKTPSKVQHVAGIPKDGDQQTQTEPLHAQDWGFLGRNYRIYRNYSTSSVDNLTYKELTHLGSIGTIGCSHF